MSSLLFNVGFVFVIYAGFSLYDYMVYPLIGLFFKKRLPGRPQCLLTLSMKDKLFIFFSKIVTSLFIYHTYTFVMNENNHIGGVHAAVSPTSSFSLLWMPIHLVALFVLYDFFYTLFHWALHLPVLYPWIHKHHHRQITPFRGINDSVNDHPIEYITGEYLHLFVLYLLSLVTPPGQLHVYTVVIFILLGGTLAGLNHTRLDVYIPYVFNVRAHDLHHAQFKYNYGQYIMLWDYLFGTYKSSQGTLKV